MFTNVIRVRISFIIELYCHIWFCLYIGGKGREGKGREGKGREGKGREGKGREGKGRGREGKGNGKAKGRETERRRDGEGFMVIQNT